MALAYASPTSSNRPWWETLNGGSGSPNLPAGGYGARGTDLSTFEPGGADFSGPMAGSLSTGTGDKSYLGSRNWGQIAGAGIGLAGSLLAPDATDVGGPTREAQDAARKLGANASDVLKQGSATISPVLHYLAALNSGDPSAILQATMPERRRVLDQYDTAKQAIRFDPRGGGTSSAMVEANAREASDLAMLGSKARTDSLKMSADLGEALTSQGLQGENAAAGHMANLLGPIMRQQENDQKSTFETFASIAALAMMFI